MKTFRLKTRTISTRTFTNEIQAESEEDAIEFHHSETAYFDETEDYEIDSIYEIYPALMTQIEDQ